MLNRLADEQVGLLSRAIFTEQQKPYEVEICVAEVGDSADGDQLYRCTYDGTIVDEPEFLVMGGQSDAITTELRKGYSAGASLHENLHAAVGALASAGGADGKPRVIPTQGCRTINSPTAPRTGVPVSSTTSAAIPGTGPENATGFSGFTVTPPTMPPPVSVPPE